MLDIIFILHHLHEFYAKPQMIIYNRISYICYVLFLYLIEMVVPAVIRYHMFNGVLYIESMLYDHTF